MLGYALTIEMGDHGRLHMNQLENRATVAELLLSISSSQVRNDISDTITNYTQSTGNDDTNNMATSVQTILSNTNDESNQEVRRKLSLILFFKSKFILSKTTPALLTEPNAEAWSRTKRNFSKKSEILKIGFSSLLVHAIDPELIQRTQIWSECKLYIDIGGISVNVLSACSKAAIKALGQHLNTLQSDPLSKLYS